MVEWLVVGGAFLAAVVFAAVWGAHLIETVGLYRVWAAAPAMALPAFVATPYAKPLGGYWRVVAPTLYLVAGIALVIAVVAGLRSHLALAVAGVCGLVHMGMVFGIFLPMNVKLGFYSGEPESRDPQVMTALVRRWGAWNYGRVGVETVGLVAALLAFRAA